MKKFKISIKIEYDMILDAKDEEEAEYIASDIGIIEVDHEIIYPGIKEINEIADINKYGNNL